MPTALADIRLALRSLRKNRTVTVLAVISISLGIGAATAIFSVANAILFEPFPYDGFDRMVSFRVVPVQEGERLYNYSMSEYSAIRDQNRVFEDVFAMGFESLQLTGGTEPEFVGGKLFSSNAFDFLGVRPLLGRTFQSDDYGSGGEPRAVIILSYLLWQRRFGGDPAVLGREVQLNGKSHTVIGVMPRRFTLHTNPNQPAIWLPLSIDRTQQRRVVIYGKLKPGVSLGAASKDLHDVFSTIERTNPERFPTQGFTVEMFPFTRFVRDWIRETVYILMAATGFLLLIACSNVANLLLARASARGKEMAVRVSVGAKRIDLLRQLLTESVLLSVTGGMLGVGFAFAGTKVLIALLPPNALPSETIIQVDVQVLAFSSCLAVLTGILFGLIPALHSTDLDLSETLNDVGRGASVSRKGNRTRNALVVLALAFSMILLVGAGLMIQTFAGLTWENPGFDKENILTMRAPLDENRYASFEQQVNFYQQVLRRVETLPGVVSAAVTSSLPPRSFWTTPVEIAGDATGGQLEAAFHLVSEEYFSTFRIPLLRGSPLSKEAIGRSDRVAVVNEEMASRFFPDGTDAVGRRIRLAVLDRESGWTSLPTDSEAWVTIIGVAGNAKNAGLREETKPAVFVPFTLMGYGGNSLAVRAESDPNTLLPAIRDEIRRVDRDQPVTQVTTMERLMGNETAGERFMMVLLSVFASIGLVLAATGVYGVMSFSVSQHVHEIGIRLALGAQRGDVVRHFLLKGGRLIVSGIALGIFGSLTLTRWIESQLYGVRPADPMVFASVAVILAVVALVACYIPSRRAAAVDPLVALRYE